MKKAKIVDGSRFVKGTVIRLKEGTTEFKVAGITTKGLDVTVSGIPESTTLDRAAVAAGAYIVISQPDIQDDAEAAG